jgi:hypothetical protein
MDLRTDKGPVRPDKFDGRLYRDVSNSTGLGRINVSPGFARSCKYLFMECSLSFMQSVNTFESTKVLLFESTCVEPLNRTVILSCPPISPDSQIPWELTVESIVNFV